MQFRVLGAIEVHRADAGVARVPRGRTLSFLALLLVNRGTIVHLDRAVDELWEGAGPENPRNAVQVVASRLRSALGDGVIVSEGGGYGLHPLSQELDADVFEDRLRRGRAEVAEGHVLEAAQTLREALAVWRGPPFAEVSHAGFAQPEIARLADLRLTCLGERLDADLACGRHAEVTGELDALVRDHPLRERFRGQLMLALYRTGRQAEALAAYRDARRALVDGLGIEPSPELRAMEAAILRQDVPAPAAASETAGPSTRSPPDVRRRVTCAFASVDATLGERDPEALRAVVERFHGVARNASTRHGGTVTELRSDAVVAVFGLRVAHEDDAQRALRAAAEMRARAEDLPGGLLTRIGVCSGDVLVPGADAKSAPLFGDVIAAAERLARSATDGDIKLAESTWRLVRHAAHAEPLSGGGYRLQELEADAPAIGRRLDRPLIGRDEEAGRLRQAVSRVTGERTAQLITILGEPGIGKSRLVAELTSIAAGRADVLIGRCPAYGEGITYWPLREIVLQVTRERSFDVVAAALELPRAVISRVAGAVGLEGGEAGEQTRSAFLQLIEALAHVRPVVIIVDDAQWAEPALLDLLLDVPEHLRSAPVLMVLTARPDPFDERPDWKRRIETGTVIRLGPLSPTASEALLQQITDTALDAAQAGPIARAAGGNPLFLEQLVEYLGEDPSDSLPPVLHALLAARLDRLGTAARAVAALGALAGDEFEPASVVALATGMGDQDVEQTCAELVRRDLLVRDGASLRFHHALVRDAAYASLAKSARARLHEQYAVWLGGHESELPEAAARIGFHLEAACRYASEVHGRVPAVLAAQGGRRLAAAAQAAHARGDVPGEIAFLERAIGLLGTDGREGVELLPPLVSALVEAGSLERADEVSNLAVSASTSLGLDGIRAQSTIQREYVRLARHPETFSVEAAIDVTEHASRTLADLGNQRGLANAAYLACDLAWLEGDVAGTYANAERMLTHALRAGSGFDIAAALVYTGWCLVHGPCPVREAIGRSDALARQAAGQRTAELSLLGCSAVLIAMTGDHARARETMAKARKGLAQHGLSEIAAHLARLDALARTLAGDPAGSERAILEAKALVARTGDRWSLSTVYADHAHAALARGHGPRAARAVARIDTVPAPCDAEWVIKRHTARALLSARAGDHACALEEARAGVAAACKTELVLIHADAHRTLSTVLEAGGGDAEGAAAAAQSALALHEAKGNTVAAAEARGQLQSLQAANRRGRGSRRRPRSA